MTKKNNGKKTPLPILIIVSAVLLYAIYASLSTLALAIWGKSVMGTVDYYSSRLENTRAEQGRSRTVFKGYLFTVNGREYRGYAAYSSDEAWPSLSEGETRSERIRYLSFFPYVNKPAMLSDFNAMGEGAIIYHILAPVVCVLLFLLVIRTDTGGKKKKAARKPAALKRIETRSDTDMFCPDCGNKLPDGAIFCSVCGAKMQASAPGVCTSCGNKLPESGTFCSSCGVKMQTSAPGMCKNCGNKLPEDADFCINCGRAVNTKPPEPAVSAQAASPAPPQNSAGLIGFSDRCNDPEILAVARENKRFAVGCMWILVFVPLIGFPVAGLLMDDFPFGESVVIGIGLALIMLVVNLIALRSRRQPVWEGVVVNKYRKERSEHKGGDDGYWQTYTEYTTVITTDAGRKKTIVERDSRRFMYDYLSVGDRVRYHPKFGTYEKYDKSKDRIIYCNVCTKMNPIQNDRCKWCNNLLFK